jgi:hypothetical protein
MSKTNNSINISGAYSTVLQLIAASPTYYKRPSLMTLNKTTVTIPANTQINIGGNGYISLSNTSLALSAVATAANRAGKNIYVYACQPSSGISPTFVLSTSSTVPSGYTATTSRKIGGFHCLCAAVGTISGHTLSGYATGDAIPNSQWDLLHRPVSDPEGMVYVEGISKWVDIYLTSYNGTKLASVYGGTIADGYSSTPFHGEKFAEYAGLCGKSLLNRDEFMVVAKGSNEGTNITGSADPGTTGGHTDTASRRMISNYGLEDCCGVMWQWTNDIAMFGNSAAATLPSTSQTSSTDGAQYLNGFSWQTDGRSVSNIYIDSTASLYGNSYGVVERVRVGGIWSDGSYCGSRAVRGHGLSSCRHSYSGCRLASESRVVCL